jgi:dephospho-CoA kinase
MLRVGLTGGIGSGKTTVAKIFEVLDIPVYYADDAAKNLMNTDIGLKTAIKKIFGEEAYTGNKLNRRFIASIVFNDSYKLDLLNSIIHPVTIQDAENWMNNHKSPYVIKEAALLFESNASENLDYIIGVAAPVQLRIQRSMQRDGISREDVIKRMNRQMDENIKMRLCDFVLRNDGQELLIPQVLQLHEKLVMLSKQRVASGE